MEALYTKIETPENTIEPKLFLKAIKKAKLLPKLSTQKDREEEQQNCFGKTKQMLPYSSCLAQNAKTRTT